MVTREQRIANRERAISAFNDVFDLIGKQRRVPGEVIARVLRRLLDYTVALSARVDELEYSALPDLRGFKYMGSWTEDTLYSKGAFVTHQGSLWHCNNDTDARPGNGGHDWTLAVKRGRDAPRH